MCNLAKLRFKWHSCDAIHLCTLARRMLIQILFISHWFFLPVPLLHLNQHDVWRSQSRGGQSWSPWSEAAQTRPCCCPTSPERLTRWGPWVRNMIYLWKLNTLEVFKIWATTWRLRRWQRPPPHHRWSLQSLSASPQAWLVLSLSASWSKSASSIFPPEFHGHLRRLAGYPGRIKVSFSVCKF